MSLLDLLLVLCPLSFFRLHHCPSAQEVLREPLRGPVIQDMKAPRFPVPRSGDFVMAEEVLKWYKDQSVIVLSRSGGCPKGHGSNELGLIPPISSSVNQ